MNYRASVKTDSDYYSQSFDLALRYGGSRRAVELTLAILALVIGCLSFVSYGFDDYLSCFLIFVGILLMVRPWIRKRIGLRQLAKKKVFDHTIEYEFSDEEISVKTVDSEGKALWTAFEKIIDTPAGFLIFLREEAYYFLPMEALSPEIRELIVSKIPQESRADAEDGLDER